MIPKTIPELRTWCQEIADKTGCVVTVDRLGRRYQWLRIRKDVLECIDGFWACYIPDTPVNRLPMGEIDFPIPGPQNWIFEPKEKSDEK